MSSTAQARPGCMVCYLPKVHMSRNLELEAELELKLDIHTQDVGISCSIFTTVPNATFKPGSDSPGPAATIIPHSSIALDLSIPSCRVVLGSGEVALVTLLLVLGRLSVHDHTEVSRVPPGK